MRIHRLLPVSQANGPGSRFVLWVQGCSRQCAGCFNPNTHSHYEGYEFSVSEIISQIPFAEVCGITISGGEPFEQPYELALLLNETGRRGLNRLVYTGFTYEELNQHESLKIRESLFLIDMLIDGPFEREKLSDMQWTGSANQRVLELHHGKIKIIYGKNDIGSNASIDCELIIDQAGHVTVTGLIDSKSIVE